MHRPLLAVVLFFQLSSQAQIDPQKLDDLKRSMDSNRKALQAWQDSFNKIQDSIYHAEALKSIEQSGRNTLDFIARKNAEEKKKEKWLYIRAGIIVLFIAVLAVLRLRRKKRNPS